MSGGAGTVVKPGEGYEEWRARREQERAISHYAHPHDPTNTTARCGEPLVGVPSTDAEPTCPECRFLAWCGDYAPFEVQS